MDDDWGYPYDETETSNSSLSSIFSLAMNGFCGMKRYFREFVHPRGAFDEGKRTIENMVLQANSGIKRNGIATANFQFIWITDNKFESVKHDKTNIMNIMKWDFIPKLLER